MSFTTFFDGWPKGRLSRRKVLTALGSYVFVCPPQHIPAFSQAGLSLHSSLPSRVVVRIPRIRGTVHTLARQSGGGLCIRRQASHGFRRTQRIESL